MSVADFFSPVEPAGTVNPTHAWHRPVRLRHVAVFSVSFLFTAFLAVPSQPTLAQSSQSANGPTKVPLAERIELLQQSYPDTIYSATNNTIRLTSNRTMVIDDGADKTRRQKELDADIEDQLSEIYPTGKCFRGRLRAFNPGLLRSIPFFKAAYGANLYQVQQNSMTIDWFGTEIAFSTRNGAARALLRVRNELRKLPENMQSVLKRPARTIEWTNDLEIERLSEHAFGIAIDLAPAVSNTWLSPRARVGFLRPYENRIHPEIVEIFERYGFIWTGKWWHFDTGHFEYRPALIAIGKLAERRGCEPIKKPPPNRFQ